MPGAGVRALVLGVAQNLVCADLSIQFKNTPAFLTVIAVVLIGPR